MRFCERTVRAHQTNVKPSLRRSFRSNQPNVETTFHSDLQRLVSACRMLIDSEIGIVLHDCLRVPPNSAARPRPLPVIDPTPRTHTQIHPGADPRGARPSPSPIPCQNLFVRHLARIGFSSTVQTKQTAPGPATPTAAEQMTVKIVVK